MLFRRLTTAAGLRPSGLLLVMLAVPMFTSVEPFAHAQTSHPWLDEQLKKQRYPCPEGTSPVRGPQDAQVTIVEFADYECPYCASEEPILKNVLAAYPTQVKLVYKNLPLDIHSGAKQKAVVAECMGAQGKFWEAHDAFLSGAAKNAREGANSGKLNACIAKGGEGQVEKDLALAKKLGMATTPGFVIDGIRQGGTITLAQFKLLIDAELARKSGTK
jgi:protein-disulfide isomerase